MRAARGGPRGIRGRGVLTPSLRPEGASSRSQVGPTRAVSNILAEPNRRTFVEWRRRRRGACVGRSRLNHRTDRHSCELQIPPFWTSLATGPPATRQPIFLERLAVGAEKLDDREIRARCGMSPCFISRHPLSPRHCVAGGLLEAGFPPRQPATDLPGSLLACAYGAPTGLLPQGVVRDSLLQGRSPTFAGAFALPQFASVRLSGL